MLIVLGCIWLCVCGIWIVVFCCLGAAVIGAQNAAEEAKQKDDEEKKNEDENKNEEEKKDAENPEGLPPPPAQVEQ